MGKSTLERYLEKKKLKEEEEKERDKTSSKIPLPSLSEARLSVSADKLHIPESMREKSDPFSASSTEKGTLERYRTKKSSQEVTAKLKTWYDEYSSYVSDYQSRTAGLTGTYNDSYSSGTSEWLADLTTRKNRLDKEADEIRGLLEITREVYGDKWTDAALVGLDMGRKTQEEILGGASSYNKYWSQWESEDKYNEWATYMRDREEKLSYDLEAGAREIALLENRLATVPLVNRPFSPIYEELNSKKAYYNLAEQLQAYESLKEQAISSPHFKSYAALGESDPRNINTTKGVKDDKYAGRYQGVAQFAANEDWLDHMTDEQREIYNYHVFADSQNGTNNAEKFLDLVEKGAQSAMYNKAYEKFDDSALGAVFYNAAANVVSAFTGIEAFLSEDGSARHSGLSESIAVASENESLKDIDLKYYNIIDKEWKDTDILGKSLGQVASEGVGTVAHMLPSVLASSLASFIGGPTVGRAVGSGMLGLSAAGAGKQQMLDLGYSKEQATAYGALVGASETLLEYAFSGISAIGGKAWDALGKTKLLSKLDNVLGNISVKAPSALVALGKTVGGMAGEAFEEGLQTIIEPWLESVVLGGDYEAPDWEEVAYSSLLGALSAAGLEGLGASVNVRQTAKTGREIQNIEGGIQKLVDTGHSYSVDTVAHKLAGKIEAAINEGKKVNAYSIGKLFIEEGATLSEQNKNDIKRGLAEMNWDENSANVMTETYARFLDESIELSQEAIDIFTENAPFTRAVVNKLIGENTTAYQRQKGYVDLERMVNGDTSGNTSAKTETKTTPEFDDATVEAIKRVKADIEGDRNLLSADRSRKIAAEANKASAEDLARNALKVEGKYTSHGSGVTRLKDTHEKVSITDVVSAKDGNVRVRLNNNKVVDLAELDLASESDAVLYEAVARMGVDAGAAKLIVNGYDSGSGVSAEAYALGMAEAINNGKYNIKQISSDGFAAMLNPIQQKLGRDIGRMSAEAAVRAEQDAINAKVAKAKAEGKAKQVGGISYDASVDTESLTDTQKAQISILEKVMPSLGVKVKLFASSVANESGKRGFTTEDGQFTSANGWYDPETGEIWVDVNAGADGKGLILVTAAHELTHFIRQWSPAKYKNFADFIISQYGDGSKTVNELVKERQDVAVERGYTLSYDEALEEVVARSCESFLQDSDAAVKIAALAQKDKSLAQKVKSFVGQLLAKIRRVAKELGLAPDSEEGKYIASMETGLQSLYDMWTDALIDAGRSFSRAGVAVDGNTESASPAFSERTWSTSEYVTERDAAARKLAESLGVSIAKAKKYIDNVNSIAKVIANDRVRLDYEASSFGSAFVSNVEYGGSFDYTTLCKKRRIYTGTFQEIQKRIGDEVLSPDDILEIRNMMIEGGIEATCGLCYVEGSRANMGKFAKEFIKLYKRDNPDGWTPTMVDVNTPDGVEQMRINHPEAYDQYQYFWDHYGKLKDSDKALFASQQKPKLYEARKEYKGEILQHFKNVDTIAKKNRNGGIRMQSFSDFEIVHLIDTMQVIMDMSQVGLAGQAYTKVPEFAEAFGNTGLKINLSLIAKDVDANGNLVFDNREGMPAETAFRLRDKYSANVGTIIVTFTDEQLHAAMADPRIDFIIPFHRSQWKKSQYGAMGLPKGTKDYTYMQNEKLIKPTYHEFRGRMVKDKASNYMPNEYWDFSKSGKENAEAYLEMCAAENKRPKFYKLLDYDGNGKYSLKKDGSTDGYWKLLIDFKMYDNDGVGSPQMPVAPDFSMDEAMTMLDEYKGGHQSYPIAHGVVDKFIENYKASNRRQFSERDSDYMDAVNRGDIETAQRLVDEAAKEAGYNSPKLYHGTKMFGFTEVKTSGVEEGVAWSPFFAANKKDISASYVPYGKVRDISSSMDDDTIEEARQIAIEERKESISDLVYDFRCLIDKHFSPWVFGQTDNSYLEGLVEDANPEAGNGDGVYDVLSEIVHDTFYDYQDEYGEYEDADDWSENSPEGQEIFSKIVDIEGEKAALHRLELGEELGGIYQLYANLDNMYVVDGKGAAWNELHPEGLPKIERYGVKDAPYKTRDVADWARDNGFDGVIFKNIRDNGAYGRTPAGDVYAFFRPESQVKSADPVTYDNNGNVIPLSQRFDSNNPDIRYSEREEKITERDSDYMDAVNRGDIETAQKMVDEAAKEAGYNKDAYHGTNQGNFTIFDWDRTQRADGGFFGRGHYFTTSQSMAKMYGKRIIKAKLKLGKTFVWSEEVNSYQGKKPPELLSRNIVSRINMAKIFPDIFANHAMSYWEYDARKGENVEKTIKWGDLEKIVNDLSKGLTLRAYADGSYKWHTEGRFWEVPVGESYSSVEEANEGKFFAAVNALKEKYDGLLSTMTFDDQTTYTQRYGTEITESLKKRGYTSAMDTHEGGEIVVFDSEQIKSADPVTYDDNGNVIPLSQRFDSKNPDIRYSEREDNVTEREILADTLMGAAANDIEKNKLKTYKAKVKEMEAEQEKLGKIKAQIKELSFAKGKRDTEKIKRLRELAVKTENRINIYDRQLLSLEATKPMRDLLERRVAEVGAREKARAKDQINDARTAGRMAQGRIDAEIIRKKDEQIKAIREQRDRKLAEQKAAFYDQKMRAAERHDKTSMRNKIRERVDSLNKLLLNPTKEKHIPMNLQKPVAELLSIINMESSDNEKVKAKLQVLKAEYEAIAKSEDPVIAAGYHPEVAERIGNVAEVVGDTALKDMNLEQLDYLYETLTIVENVVRNANKGFKIAKGKTITDYGLNVMHEILDMGGKDHMSNDTLDAISRFKWANLKPVYAFERIGSGTFTELFNNVRAGEDTWATDVSEARAFFLEKAKKYKYFDWDLEKTQEFSGKFGKKFELTLPQMMSLYAYSKRKQADLHLEDGGFVFEKAVKVKKKRGVPIEYTVKVADPFSLRKEHLAVIVASLTDEQRAFVDEMQTYLSLVMGAKGNEVAREMYGIDLFKETDYFPLKSSSYYLAYNPEKDAQSKVKNYGMAKETVKNANNPIILSDFMDVWGKHVDEMSMYHAFVLPMEDFSKVFNFNTPTKDDGGNKTSVQSRLTNAYGDEAVRYIKNLITDLNGGARSDPNLGIINRLVGMFKKAKVFLSASVVIQQPSSIGRAFAVINPKYFTPNIKQKHGDAWNELKKYAPIATIKEMGYFDTNVGQSTVDYITGRDYNTLTEKIKGIATDKNYRDEAMGKLPAIADEMAWLQIWNAAKNEIADTTDLERGTEEFLNTAGKRFTEAVVKTQVYDSVLSRSAWMRSKDGLSKMLTSFLAEPTTTANMMSNAILQASRGNKKHFAATLGAVMTSIVMNSMLVSLVYAARDDDEDEAFTEKYVESLVTELIEGVNPATYLPIVKDIWSLLQGYDVERSDMSLISDLIDAIYGMLDDNKAWEEKIERLAVTLADMSGVPLNNVVKDIRAAFRFGSTLFDDIKPTDIGMEGAIKDAVIDSVPFLDKFIKSASKSDKLYKAITSGSEEELERAESAYKTDTSLETAIKKGLRENDSRVKKAALAIYSGDTRAFGEYVKAIAAEGNFDSETVEAAIRAEASAYKTKIEGAAAALEDGDQEAYKDLIRELRKAYKGILSQDEIVKAVSEYEKPAEEAEDGFEEVESIYKMSDINTALESGDTDHALEIVKEILEVKVENNLAKARLEAEKSGKRFVEKKALKEAQTAANASVRSSLTSYWKKRYLEAFEAKDYAETERIRRLLHSTGVYGKLSELDADLKEWRKNN